MTKAAFFIYSLVFLSFSSSLQSSNFSYIHKLKLPNNPKHIPKNVTLIKENKNFGYIWHKSTPHGFTELIASWNAIRPKKGNFSFFVRLNQSSQWSTWRKFAEWGITTQKTFSNAKDPFVHIKHVRTEVQRGRKAHAFQIKVLAENGASIKNVKALFANTANWDIFKKIRPSHNLQSVSIKHIPRLSQWHMDHHRRKDLCAPTSTSMICHYFLHRLKKYHPSRSNLYLNTKRFAEGVRDSCYLDIYGNWLFNTANAFTTTFGKIFYRVQRMNSFNELHWCLTKQVPIPVSLRGYIPGGHHVYKNGHFVVVMGWNKKDRTVLCIDPAFGGEKEMLRAYHINDFLRAWGKSKNLAFVSLKM